ncbi:MAG: hypothetical protein WCK51_00535 [Armatimonadota bacterium]
MLGFLFGEDREPQPSPWLREWQTRDDAPIIRLVDAILAQAVNERSSGIRFVVDPNRIHIDVPTEEQWQKRVEIESWMTENKIPRSDQGDTDPELWVDYEIDNQWRVAMIVPGNLTDPTICRLRVRLNYKRFASLEEPENLIYVDGSFLHIERFSLTDSVRALIRIEPDPD